MKSLAAQVDELECRFSDLHSLAGDIVATISVNFSKGHILTNNGAEFGKMIAEWESRIALLHSAFSQPPTKGSK